MEIDDLTYILLRLDAGRTRATYGAVAGVLGVPPMFLMSRRPRDPLHSWVVNKRTGLPSGYTEDMWHKNLLQNERVIRGVDQLQAYIKEREDADDDSPAI